MKTLIALLISVTSITSLSAELIMVATVNRVPVYIRGSQFADEETRAQTIQRAIEGELVVQHEPASGSGSGTGSEKLRSEIERLLEEQYSSRKDFHEMLKSEYMTYEDYIYEQRRIYARDTVEAWIVEINKRRSAHENGEELKMSEAQESLSAEERSPEYRKKAWNQYIANLKEKSKIEMLPVNAEQGAAVNP